MDQDRSATAIHRPPGEQLVSSRTGGDPSLLADMSELEQPLQPVGQTEPLSVIRHNSRSRLIWITTAVLFSLIMGGSGYVLLHHGSAAKIVSGSYGVVDLPLSNLEKSNLPTNSASSLKINGQLQVSQSVTLGASSKPTNPQSGQLYYDKTSHQLGYYDGTGYVYLQGGAATSIINNYTTGPSTYVNNVTNVTNVNGGGVTSTGTAGHIAMFTGATTLGNSVIIQSGSNLAVGTQAGTAATTLQGGTGGISIFTGNQAGASGDITIQSGDSSTTASGDIDIDTGSAIITGTLVGSKDFESGTGSMVDCFGFSDTLAQSAAQAHGGSNSLALTVGPVGSYARWCMGESAPYTSEPVVAGHNYAFSMWVRAGTASAVEEITAEFSSNGFSGGGVTGTSQWGLVTDVASGWTHVTGTVVAPAGSNFVALTVLSNSAATGGDVHYFDDYTVTDLSSSTSVADLNLGATNAQRVTLGNAAQIGTTSIYGSGITIDGGLGNFNIHGGAYTQTTATADLHATSGALNITASATSTWQVANGSLLIKTGDANGCNCGGGNLTLQAGAGSGTGISGSINADTQAGAVSGTVVDTRSFETGTENMLATSGDSVAQTNSAALSGSFSLRETSTGGPWAVDQDQTAAGIPVTAGHKYYFSAWVHAGNTPVNISSHITWLGHGTLTLNGTTSPLVGWTQISGTGTAPAGTTQAFWSFSGSDAGAIDNFFDALTATDLSTATTTAAINVGANFAQAITIGNINQVDPTKIQGGGGINIDSGVSNLTLTGTITAKPQIDSASAFVIQDTSGSSLLSADTTNSTITISKLIVSGDITINGHIITGGATPSILAGTAACTTPAVSINGNDTSGTITVATGSGCAVNGTLATVTFSVAYGTAPVVNLTPGSANSLTLGAYIDDATVTTSSFKLNTNTTPSNSTTYKWNYLIAQ